MLFSENAGFVGKPVVGVDDVWLEICEVIFDKIDVLMLDVADGKLGASAHDNFGVEVGRVVGPATVAEKRVEIGRRDDMHEIRVLMLRSIGNDKIDVGTLIS